jgi:hypothetical protein
MSGVFATRGLEAHVIRYRLLSHKIRFIVLLAVPEVTLPGEDIF